MTEQPGTDQLVMDQQGSELPVIELVRPMPGFPERRQFALVRMDEQSMLASLRSVEDPDLRFLVVPPGRFFPDYAPEVGLDVAAELGVASADDVLLLVVLTAGDSLAETTANLAAPILINTVTRRAAQVILDGAQLPVAAPLLG